MALLKIPSEELISFVQLVSRQRTQNQTPKNKPSSTIPLPEGICLLSFYLFFRRTFLSFFFQDSLVLFLNFFVFIDNSVEFGQLVPYCRSSEGLRILHGSNSGLLNVSVVEMRL